MVCSFVRERPARASSQPAPPNRALHGGEVYMGGVDGCCLNVRMDGVGVAAVVFSSVWYAE